MPNLKIKILVAITAFSFAFTIGIFTQKRYPRLFRQPVSLCAATNSRSIYQTLRGNDTFTLRGYLYGGKVYGFGDADLKACENSTAEVDIDEQKNKAFYNMHDLLGELRVPRSHEEFPRVEVEIIGRLRERQNYCFTSRYVIEVDAISPLGSIEVVNAADLFSQAVNAQ
jgi:hypothetical protein